MVHGEKSRTHVLDTGRASTARMRDWLLGGTENYEVDRTACEELLRIAPGSREVARANRDFLTRAVRFLAAEKKIGQFLDHGAGLPARRNVHEIAQGARKDAKVVYIDNDPMVLAYARTSLDENDNTMVLDCDLRDTAAIRRATHEFIDWTEPIAALFVSVLHCLPEHDGAPGPAAVVSALTDQLPAGSYLVICQLVSDDPAVRQDATRLMRDATGKWGRVRETHEVRRYFDDLVLEEPGLGDVADWRPDELPPPPHLRPAQWREWGGVGHIAG